MTFVFPCSEKPDYLSNSQLTSTSERLCQHLKFNPEKYEDRRGNLGNLATKLDRVSQELSNTFTRSVTFSDSMMRKPSMEQIVRIDHLYDKEFPEAKLSRFTPSISRSEKSRYYPTDDYTMVERRDYPLATYDSLAKKYYPVTFSAVLEEEKLKDQLSRSQCMSAPASGRKHAYTRAKSALQKLRQTAVDDKYYKYNSRDFQMMERSDEEKMYSMLREAPTIGKCCKHKYIMKYFSPGLFCLFYVYFVLFLAISFCLIRVLICISQCQGIRSYM